MTDRIVLITGATRGIGFATCKRFIDNGDTVIGVARNKDGLNSVRDEFGRNFIPFQADVTDAEQVNSLFDFIEVEFSKLDVLVNNAGVSMDNSIFDMPVENWDKTMALNLRGPFLCSRRAVKIMKNQNRGRIINVGSVRSIWIEKGSAGAYNASKFGLRAFTETLAREVKKYNIAVSIICPGIVDTPLTNPDGTQNTSNWLTPQTVADAIFYMCSVPDNVNLYQLTIFPIAQSVW